MATGVFGLRKVYIKQNENIDNRNFASWTESALYAYTAGGIPATTLIERLDFSSEVVSLPGKNLSPLARTATKGTFSSLYGYFGGGFNPVPSLYINTITRLDFSNETVSDPGKNFLSVVRDVGASISGNLYGYYASGTNTAPGLVYTSVITRLDFSNETVSDPGSINLPISRGNIGSLSSSSYGYFGGGYFPTPVRYCTITRLDFSSETVSDPGKNLSSARSSLDGVSNVLYGYFAGGVTPATSPNTISRLDFSNESITDLSNGLPTLSGKRSYDGASSISYGYIIGGFIPGYTSNISRLDLSTEITSDLVSKLSSSRGVYGLVSGGQSIFRGSKTYGYFASGFVPTTTSVIVKLDFSTENASVLSGTGQNLPAPIAGASAVSNNYYGYFGGGLGSCTISRLDFSNETISSPTKNLPVRRYLSSTVSSSSYGYFGAGSNPTTPEFYCSIIKLDFSTENATDLGSTVSLTANLHAAAGVSGNLYGYFSGGFAPPSYISTIRRLDFSNETVSSPPVNLPGIRGSHAAVSNNRYGYFAAGATPTLTNSIIRFDFSTETLSPPGNNLPYGAVELLAGVSSGFYGYFAGGTTGSLFCNIGRIDFSNETTSAPGKNLPTVRQAFSGVSNSN